jgi:ABC-type Mn2+/Zn2+ transport system ATPase subunit
MLEIRASAFGGSWRSASVHDRREILAVLGPNGAGKNTTAP